MNQALLTRMKNCVVMGQMIKGSYATPPVFKGNAVGCLIESINETMGKRMSWDDTVGLAEVLGWPLWLVELYDALFEKLPEPDNTAFAIEFLEAVPEGLDLEPLLLKYVDFVEKNTQPKLVPSPVKYGPAEATLWAVWAEKMVTNATAEQWRWMHKRYADEIIRLLKDEQQNHQSR